MGTVSCRPLAYRTLTHKGASAAVCCAAHTARDGDGTIGPHPRNYAGRARTRQKESIMFDSGIHSVLGLLILVGDVWAIINIFQSPASNGKKLLWTLLVIFLPFLGLVLWFFLGP